MAERDSLSRTSVGSSVQPAPKQSHAKSEKIQAINEGNKVICGQIQQLEEMKEKIKNLDNSLARERKVMAKACTAVGESLVMPRDTYQQMLETIHECTRAAMSEPPINQDQFGWLDDEPEPFNRNNFTPDGDYISNRPIFTSSANSSTEDQDEAGKLDSEQETHDDNEMSE